MKKYVKPQIEIIELRINERIADAQANSKNQGAAPIIEKCS